MFRKRASTAKSDKTPSSNEEAIAGNIYELIFENANVGLFEVTLAGKFVRANSRLADMLGYESAQQMVEIVEDLAQAHYVHKSDREEILDILRRDRRVDKYLSRNVHRNGTIMWLRVSAVAIGGGAKPLHFVGTAEDVSDLIETQKALEDRQEEYERLYMNAAEGIYRSSPAGKMLAANPAQARLNGYETAEQLLENVRDIAKEWYVDPDDRDRFKERIEREGHVTNFESEIYRHKTGERAWVRENSWVVKDENGAVLYYEGTVKDVTSEKQATDALRVNEGRQRDFAETSSDWFWESDAEHRFSFISENAWRFRIDSVAAIGQRRLDWLHDLERTPEEVTALEKNLADMNERRPFREFIYRLLTIDGATEFVSISGRPHYDARGRFLGYRGSCRMVTEEINAANALKTAQKTAEDASLAKSRFLANMSHELRTPLNAIIGFAEMLKMELYGPLGHARYQEYLGDIHVSANMLLSLIEDMLDISKAEAGRLDLDETVFEMAHEIDIVSQMMSPVAQRRKVKLALETPSEDLLLFADIKRFRQIAINLATNAVKFSTAGSVVRLGVQREDNNGLTFFVGDEGEGMNAEEITRALRPFEQLTDSRELANEGAGLGLPLSNELAERHDAVLDIRSARGKGTTVFVRFPVERTRATAVGEAEEQRAVNRKTVSA